jgi:putative gp21|nr:MAG TPA: tail length tape measure protein [Caudoviricetes sp.]
MTQIQASVNVEDKIDSKIEQKIKAIGVASVTTANQLNVLKNAVSSLSSRNINGFSNAITNLGRTNFSGLASQMRQLSQVSSQLNGSFSETALQATKLQIAQTKLQQEQTKASILTTRLQREQQALSNAQNQGAISANNLANAQARANTAQIRSQIASTQAITATIRLQQAQARLEQQFQRNSHASAQTNIGLRQLIGTMFILSGAVSTAIGMSQLGDQYQSAINKLTLVADNAERARNRLASLTDIAKNSYSDLQSTTQLYTRLDMALKQTGGSASEAMQITQTLTKTVALAGLTSAESSSALLQISQAFNKGKLDGDEFRTVMETMPPLADALARKLGVTRGELLELAPKGKITGEVMKQAFLDAAESVDQRFANLTPTVAMHLQNLQTEAQTYFGAMFKDTGLAETFGNAIKYISNNLELATKVAVAFGVAVAFSAGLKTLSSLITTIDKVKIAYAGATGIIATFNGVVGASPIGWLIAGVSALAIGMDYLFDTGLGKSLFPSYDQDKAKVDDYISRLKDINTQMGLMSYTKLTQENALLNQAMEKNKSTISETEKKIADLNIKIAEQQKTYDNATATLERYKNNQLTEKDEYAIAQGIKLNELALQRQAEAQQRLIDLQAEQATTARDLDKANENNVEIMKSVLYNMEEQIERIDNAKKAIDGKKDSDIEANEELKTQKKIVEESKEKYEKLTKSVKDLRSQLQLLLGLSADLAPAINETGEKTKDKVTEELKNRIQKETQWQLDYSKASKEKQRAMEVEKQLSKDLEKFRGNDGSLTKEGQSLLDERIKAQKALDDRKQADAEAQRNARKHLKDAQSEAKERQKAIEKQEQYVGKLDDELALLKEGYQNYSKYNSLYALRLELQQRGVNLTDQEMSVIKSKIDAVEREKELAKQINAIEENSLARQQEQWRLKLDALSKANISQQDRQINVDNMVGSMGATYGVNQGLEQLKAQHDSYYQHIEDLRRKNYLSEEQAQMALQTLDSQYQDAIYNKRLENLHNMGGMYEVVASAFESFTQNATNNLMSVLTGTKSISDAMRDLASTILNSVVHAIIEMGVKWVAQQVMQMTFGKAMMATQLATSSAMATAMASAWATPATLVSLASYGANAPPAMAGMASTLAMAQTMAIAGARRNGGTVNAGDLYQVGEGNAPEIYQSRSGRQYMIAGDNGRVFSNKQVMGGGGHVVHVTQNVTINGNGQLDADTLNQFREQTRTVIYEVLAEEQRDAGGMLA